MSRSRRIAGAVCLVVLVAVFGGCTLVKGALPLGGGLLLGGYSFLGVEVDDRLNGDAPLAVDLVVVYDGDLDKTLSTYTSDQWFAKRSQLLGDASLLTLRSWEWTPGQRVSEQRFEYRRGALAAFLFADYRAAGEHRQRFLPNRSLYLQLGDSKFTTTLR